jgi:4-amino-4-deoxy-L-arabinose transferase-like glycosyltransferase
VPPPRSLHVWLLGAFTVVYFAGTLWLARGKLFWFDELFTWHLARLPRLADLWAALASGTDLNPPLGYLATRWAQALFGAGPVATRLPAALGFWVLSVCLYRFVARRCGALGGGLALALPLASVVSAYAYEARPYGLVLGCCGGALVCWQEAAEARRRRLALCGLAGSLAAGVLCHYYAVLLLAPLAVGEAVRSWTRRRLDVPVWLALAAGVLPLGLLLPLLVPAREFAATFWAKPRWGALEPAYLQMLGRVQWPLIAAAVLAVLVPGRIGNAPAPGPRPPAHEWAAALGLTALPALALLLGQLVTGVFVPRYALAALAGFGILLAFLACRVRTGRGAVAGILVAVLLVGFVAGEVRDGRRLARDREQLARTCALLQAQGDADLPVVVSDPLAFLQLTHYAPPALAARLVYLSDPDASLRHAGWDTSDRALRELRRWAALNVADYGPFRAAHSCFLVYGRAGWLRPALEADGVHFEPCGGQDTALFIARVGP